MARGWIDPAHFPRLGLGNIKNSVHWTFFLNQASVVPPSQGNAWRRILMKGSWEFGAVGKNASYSNSPPGLPRIIFKRSRNWSKLVTQICLKRLHYSLKTSLQQFLLSPAKDLSILSDQRGFKRPWIFFFLRYLTARHEVLNEPCTSGLVCFLFLVSQADRHWLGRRLRFKVIGLPSEPKKTWGSRGRLLTSKRRWCELLHSREKWCTPKKVQVSEDFCFFYANRFFFYNSVCGWMLGFVSSPSPASCGAGSVVTIHTIIRSIRPAGHLPWPVSNR